MITNNYYQMITDHSTTSRYLEKLIAIRDLIGNDI